MTEKEELELGSGIQSLINKGTHNESDLDGEGKIALRKFRHFDLGEGVSRDL